MDIKELEEKNTELEKELEQKNEKIAELEWLFEKAKDMADDITRLTYK